MSWSKDLLDWGLITDSEYEAMRELGSDIRDYGDTEAIQDLMLIGSIWGLDEFVDRMIEEWDKSIAFYEAQSGYTIVYEPELKHWRDIATGRFVKDPYELIRY